ncbi:MAG: DMT family transporter [Lachnospiraceae bacterium]|nr:DMT family transporter [Lachnospiraceae bacterium]
MSKKLKGSIFLLMAAVIWGSAFVPQSIGMKYVEPFTYNTFRSIVGFLVLIPVVIYFRKKSLQDEPMSKDEEKALNRRSIFAGLVCGLALSVATSFQQLGISMTTAGKAAFITVLYIIMVPIIAVFTGQKIPKIIWPCALISLTGFYLMCIKEGFYLSPGDMYCLLCAFCFSVQICLIDHFTKHEKKVDPVMISAVQFLVVTVISLILTLLLEKPDPASIWEAKYTILYTGVLSSGVAYTFQILGQKDSPPAISPLIMSLESVFAAFFGWILLNEAMNPRELIGCALVLIACLLSQLPLPSKGAR